MGNTYTELLADIPTEMSTETEEAVEAPRTQLL